MHACMAVSKIWFGWRKVRGKCANRRISRDPLELKHYMPKKWQSTSDSGPYGMMWVMWCRGGTMDCRVECVLCLPILRRGGFSKSEWTRAGHCCNLDFVRRQF